MLSQIENGAARPSMETLCYLAGRLGKPVGFFLNEDTASPNQALVQRAREAFLADDCGSALEILESYTSDGVFDPEAHLLQTLCCLQLAQAAIEDGRVPYSLTLLQRAKEAGALTPYYTRDLERRRCLLLAQAAPEEAGAIASQLGDEELLLRAQAAYWAGEFTRAAAILDCAANQKQERFSILRGDVYFAAGEYARAAGCYRNAEEKCLHRLELCYEKLEDYKMAYYYACQQR
jgi:tetratricopeptide (TPR) repeat protein